MSEQKRERKITVRIWHGWEDMQRFDDEWWDAVPPHRRAEMIWDLVEDARAIQGLEGNEPRLQRSVLVVERR